MKRRLTLTAVALMLVLGAGCVERKLVIRSRPAGAPVWVDETAAGETPAEYEFKHYGRRRIRVGPVRDESGALLYAASERIVEPDVPWYETFPIDFFFEVLWPGTLVDVHQYDFQLGPPSREEYLYSAERAKDLVEEGEQFREKALSPVPEQQR